MQNRILLIEVVYTSQVADNPGTSTTSSDRAVPALQQHSALREVPHALRQSSGSTQRWAETD
jgi:hypothetical protein